MNEDETSDGNGTPCVPFFAVGSDELEGLPEARAGDLVDCDVCGGRHALEAVTDADGRPTAIMLTYRCGGDSYLAALDGRNVMGLRRAAGEGEGA